MVLEFISDSEGGLLVRLDERGLGELLASVAAAMKTGEPQPVPANRDSPGAIGQVTVAFRRPRNPRRPRPEPRLAEDRAHDFAQLRR